MEMTAAAFITPSTRGASNEARFVEDRVESSRRRLHESYALGLPWVFDELYTVAEFSREPNWDGYGAEPVSNDTYGQAYRFLESLPLGVRPPTISPEPDGHLAFEWHVAPRRTLSVSVSPDGDLHYSALLGPGKAYGTEVFLGEIPRTIIELIRRVYSA